eukprot:1023347-Rhodomonas_salina.2
MSGVQVPYLPMQLLDHVRCQRHPSSLRTSPYLSPSSPSPIISRSSLAFLLMHLLLSPHAPPTSYSVLISQSTPYTSPSTNFTTVLYYQATALPPRTYQVPVRTSLRASYAASGTNSAHATTTTPRNQLPSWYKVALAAKSTAFLVQSVLRSRWAGIDADVELSIVHDLYYLLPVMVGAPPQ